MTTQQDKAYSQDAQQIVRNVYKWCLQNLLSNSQSLTLLSMGIMQLVAQMTSTTRHIVTTIVHIPESDTIDSTSEAPADSAVIVTKTTAPNNKAIGTTVKCAILKMFHVNMYPR
jgi:hypothetical protein